MYISKVSLVNFRNFSRANFHFEKGINTIIGENGSGKTNLFRAIRLMLEISATHLAYKLDESDFNRKLKDWRGHWIIISLEFSGISSDEAIQALFIHRSGIITDADKVSKATYNLFFRPTESIRKKLASLAEGDKAGLEEILSNLNIKDHYETFFTGRSSADFSDPIVYKELVGDFDQVIFKNEGDTSKYGANIPKPLSISKEVSFTFIKALRDVVSDFYDNKTNPLFNLLKFKSGDISPDDFAPISNQVQKLNDTIEDLNEVQTIRDDIKSTINETVGETYAPATISIKSSLSEEASKLLQSLKLFIAEPNEDYEGAIQEMSLGGANLIYLTLKLLEYKYNKGKNPIANFLLIEEPEAHIHTHIQKTLFDKINFDDTQIIYSTHSPQISEVSKISKMNILSKRKNYAEVYHPFLGLDSQEISRIERYLDAIRSNLLFAKGVILVEGDAEEILIPTMVKKVFGVTLDELGVSLINIRSTGFKNISILFHENRIRNRCSIITDLDAPVIDNTTTASATDAMNDSIEQMNRAEMLGKKRKQDLDENYESNAFVKPFYAKHTFEVDFLLSGNLESLISLLPVVYETSSKQKVAQTDLESGDIALQAKRVLTIAERLGKGWFATLLSEHINEESTIPDYIIQAIAFASANVNRDVIRRIIKYRIDTVSKHQASQTTKQFLKVLENDSGHEKISMEVVDEMTKIIEDDQISTFVKALTI